MGHGVWFRGRCYPAIRGAEDDPAAEAQAALASAQQRIAELEAGLADAGAHQTRAEQLAADLAAVQAERDAHSARVAELEAAQGQAVSRGLDAYRRALIAENAGQLVEELVTGATEEALDASVAAAKAAYQRVQDLVKAGLQQHRTPGGGGTRTGPDLEKLSPLDKIRQGLAGNK